MSRIALSMTAALLALAPIAPAQDAKTETKKPARPSIYDAKADARQQVKAATALARRDARRVLVLFGGDWCGWCHKLHDVLANDRDVHALLADEYVLVLVDTQAPHADELLRQYQGDVQSLSYPFLAVLDGQGNVVIQQKTEPLEEGDHHDPAKVAAFLSRWAAPKTDASKVFDDGLAKASAEDKLVFLHFGSPTCGWCHKLDAFLARDDMAEILGRQFVDVKIDLARMTGADGLLKRYKPDRSGGIPWFLFVDAKGSAITNSDGPQGNIGYPAAPHEIEHFVGMLRKAARRLTPEQLSAVEAALKAEAKQIEAARTVPRAE